MAKYRDRIREVLPIPEPDRELDLEEAREYLQALQELRGSRGYTYLRELADAVTFTAYTEMIKGKATELDKVAYAKGQIGGLESLFQNLNAKIEEFQDYVEGMDEELSPSEEVTDGD